MRQLFTFVGGEGHLQPMLPLANTTAAEGHTVTGASSLGPTVRRAGLGFVSSGQSVRPQRRFLQPVDLDNEYQSRGGIPSRSAVTAKAEFHIVADDHVGAELLA